MFAGTPLNIKPIPVPGQNAKPQQVYENNLLFDTFVTAQKYPKGHSSYILVSCNMRNILFLGHSKYIHHKKLINSSTEMSACLIIDLKVPQAAHTTIIIDSKFSDGTGILSSSRARMYPSIASLIF